MHNRKKTGGSYLRKVTAVLAALACMATPIAVSAETAQTQTAPVAADAIAQSDIVISCADEAVSLESEQSVSYTFDVPADGLYTLGLKYRPLDEKNTSIKVAVKIDDAYVLPAMESLEFPKMWTDDGDARVDGNGNEFAPTQKLAEGYFLSMAVDTRSNYSEPLEFSLTQGQHTVTVTAVESPFALAQIVFGVPERPMSYAEYRNAYASAPVYDGDELTLEGEDAYIKTSSSLIPLSDSADPGMSPVDPVKSKLNYIGGSNWGSKGDKLTWIVDVPKTGFYRLGVWYRQNGVLNGSSYRWLQIDGETPFEEAMRIAFPYSYNWSYFTFADENEQPYWIYLEEGRREISLSVTLGELDEVKTQLESVSQELGDLYVSITMVTGDTVDTYRDYQLFAQIPDFNGTLQRNIDALTSLEERMMDIYQENSNSYIAQMKNMRLVLQKMLDNPYIAHRYKQNYYNTYSGLTASANELGTMPLDIDRICLYSPDKEVDRKGSGFFEKILFAVKRFIASFTEDYNSISGTNQTDSIEIWVNWGRDQAQVLNSLIQESFTQESQIGVSVKVTNASIIQAILSGNGPDCSLHLSRTEPVNLAMRGGLYELSQFPDYEEIQRYHRALPLLR